MKIPEVIPDSKKLINRPMYVNKIPHSLKSPFPVLSEPNMDQILISLTSQSIIIFSDGSTAPNPGIG